MCRCSVWCLGSSCWTWNFFGVWCMVYGGRIELLFKEERNLPALRCAVGCRLLPLPLFLFRHFGGDGNTESVTVLSRKGQKTCTCTAPTNCQAGLTETSTTWVLDSLPASESDICSISSKEFSAGASGSEAKDSRGSLAPAPSSHLPPPTSTSQATPGQQWASPGAGQVRLGASGQCRWSLVSPIAIFSSFIVYPLVLRTLDYM